MSIGASLIPLVNAVVDQKYWELLYFNHSLKKKKKIFFKWQSIIIVLSHSLVD